MKLFLALISAPYIFDHDTAWSKIGPFLVKAKNEEQVVEKLRPQFPQKEGEVQNEKYQVYLVEIEDKEVIFIPESVLDVDGYKQIKV